MVPKLGRGPWINNDYENKDRNKKPIILMRQEHNHKDMYTHSQRWPIYDSSFYKLRLPYT